MSQIPKKRGQLSLDEEKFIKESVEELSIEEIASKLNRNIAPIQRFIKENRLLIANSEDSNEYEILKIKLHSKTFWQEILRQFDEDSGELKYFEDTWIGLIKQFREDVLPEKNYK